MHSPSSLSSEEKPAPKEYTVHFKMHRQDSQITHLSVSNHSLRSSKRTASTRSVDSTLSASSTEREAPWLSPQGYLDVLFRSRKLFSERFKVLETGYSNAPTPLQTSSYDPFVVELVKNGDAQVLEKMLQAGISPNPYSITGESLIHLICRRGDSKILKLFLDYGASLQVSDALGRTPLHEVCWAKPCFDTIELILKADVQLLNMVDGRGAAPLSYVRKDYWKQWIAFLKAKQHVFWPQTAPTYQARPPLTLHEPDSLPLSDPLGALSPKQAAMVVSGRISPENARFIPVDDCSFGDDEDDDDQSYDDDDDDDDSKSFASEYDNRDDTCFTTDTFDMHEMECLLRQLSRPSVATRIEV